MTRKEIAMKTQELKKENSEITCAQIGEKVGIPKSKVLASLRKEKEKAKRHEKNIELRKQVTRLYKTGMKPSELCEKLGVTESKARTLIHEEIDRRILKKHTADPHANISDTMKEFDVSKKRVINLLTKAANNGLIVYF